MVWFQTRLELPAFARGCHLITHRVEAAMAGMPAVQVGLLHVFLLHTSASLTINENADADVRRDMETALNQLVPEASRFVHTVEGPDDMPAHVKSSLFGCSLLIPLTNSHMVLGTWQGIYLCEHRNHGGRRQLVLTVQGQ